MANCLIITAIADEFAMEISRLTDGSIDVTACATPEQALAEYTNETVLFGNPADIAKVLPQMSSVDWVQSSWAGVTPLIENDRRDYTLTGVKDVFGPQMSEYVFGYLLAHELKVLERLKQQRRHNWFREHSGVLEGKTIGIMGTGSIGQHIAKTSLAFGMTSVGLSRSGTAVDCFEHVMSLTGLHDFLAQTDYLVAALPATAETHHLLDNKSLSHLHDHTYFVNVGRSNVVDDTALIDALRTGKLAGAALDVFDEEPLPDDSPLWDTPNLSITAHVAAISHSMLIVPIFIDNYRRYIDRKPLKFVVDFEAGY